MIAMSHSPSINNLDGITRANPPPNEMPTRGKRPRVHSVEASHTNTIRNDANSLLAGFEALRNYDLFLDLNISTKSTPLEIVSAHACFLAARAPGLGALLGRLERDPQTLKFNLILSDERIRIGAVRKVIAYLYTGDITIKTNRELQDITEAAAALEVGLPESFAVMHVNQFVLKNVLLGHSGYVCALAMTSQGLVSGSRDHSLLLWNYLEPNPKKLELPNAHKDRVWALATMTQGGKEKLISGGWDSSLILWDTTTWQKEKIVTQAHESWITCLVSVGEKYLVSASADKTLKVWISRDFEPERTLRAHSDHVYGLAVSPKANLLFSAGNDGMICVWETVHWRLVHQSPKMPEVLFRALSWCSALNCLVSGSSDGSLRCWTVSDTLTLQNEVAAHTDWIESLVDMDRGRFASGSRDCSIKIWNAQLDWTCLQTIRQHTHWVYALLFSNKMLISASCDMTIKVFATDDDVEE